MSSLNQSPTPKNGNHGSKSSSSSSQRPKRGSELELGHLIEQIVQPKNNTQQSHDGSLSSVPGTSTADETTSQAKSNNAVSDTEVEIWMNSLGNIERANLLDGVEAMIRGGMALAARSAFDRILRQRNENNHRKNSSSIKSSIHKHNNNKVPPSQSQQPQQKQIQQHKQKNSQQAQQQQQQQHHRTQQSPHNQNNKKDAVATANHPMHDRKRSWRSPDNNNDFRSSSSGGGRPSSLYPYGPYSGGGGGVGHFSNNHGGGPSGVGYPPSSPMPPPRPPSPQPPPHHYRERYGDHHRQYASGQQRDTIPPGWVNYRGGISPGGASGDYFEDRQHPHPPHTSQVMEYPLRGPHRASESSRWRDDQRRPRHEFGAHNNPFINDFNDESDYQQKWSVPKHGPNDDDIDMINGNRNHRERSYSQTSSRGGDDWKGLRPTQAGVSGGSAESSMLSPRERVQRDGYYRDGSDGGSNEVESRAQDTSSQRYRGLELATEDHRGRKSDAEVRQPGKMPVGVSDEIVGDVPEKKIVDDESHSDDASVSRRSRKKKHHRKQRKRSRSRSRSQDNNKNIDDDVDRSAKNNDDELRRRHRHHHRRRSHSKRRSSTTDSVDSRDTSLSEERLASRRGSSSKRHTRSSKRRRRSRSPSLSPESTKNNHELTTSPHSDHHNLKRSSSSKSTRGDSSRKTKRRREHNSADGTITDRREKVDKNNHKSMEIPLASPPANPNFS